MRIALPLRPFFAIKHNPVIVLLLFVFLFCSGPTAEADTNVGGTISTDTTWTLACAYGKTASAAALAWKKKVQASSPEGYTARHILPKCKKVR